MPIVYTSAVQRYNGLVLNYIPYTASSSLNDLLKSIDNTLGDILNTPVSVFSSDITYDGSNNICLTVQLPTGNLNDVLEYLGSAVCSVNGLIYDEGGDIIDADPLGTYSLPLNTPAYSYPVLPTLPTPKPVSTYTYPPTTGIINYNPVDTRIAGHFSGVISALNFADSYANIRPDYDYLKATLSGLSDNFAQSIASTTPAALNVSFGAGNYYVSGRRVYVAANSILMTAFADNYIDVTISGAYVNNHVPNGNAAPVIAANTMRLFKLVTNAAAVTATTVLAQLYPYGNTYLQSQSVNTRVLADDSVGPAQLIDTAVTPGVYDFLSATVDQQGRITAAASAVAFTGLTDLDVMQYNIGTGKWANVPIVGSILPAGNMGDFLRYNTVFGTWYASTVIMSLWAPIVLSYTDFTGMGGASGYILVGIPAGSIIKSYKIKHSASFTGGTIATALVQIIDANGTDYTAGGFDVFQAPGNTVGVFNCGLSGSIIPPQTGANDVKLKLTVTGDVLANLATGDVNIWFEYVELI